MARHPAQVDIVSEILDRFHIHIYENDHISIYHVSYIYDTSHLVRCIIYIYETSIRVMVGASRMEGSEVHAGTPHPRMDEAGRQPQRLLHAIIVLSLSIYIWRTLFQNVLSTFPKKMGHAISTIPKKCVSNVNPKFQDCVSDKSSSYMYIRIYSPIYENLLRDRQCQTFASSEETHSLQWCISFWKRALDIYELLFSKTWQDFRIGHSRCKYICYRPLETVGK